jgi:hypothetical protein
MSNSPTSSLSVLSSEEAIQLDLTGSVNNSPGDSSHEEPEIYYALDDYVDCAGEGVNLRRGQQVHVLSRESANGWWFVKLDENVEGWAPSAFLQNEKVKPPRPPRPKSDRIVSLDFMVKPPDQRIVNEERPTSQLVDKINDETTDSANDEYKPIKVSEMRKRFE